MPITRADVVKVAELARLELTDKEADTSTEELQRILSYVEKLSELDTSGVLPMTSTGQAALMRSDTVTDSITREEALKNAPDEERGCFKVPQIIE
ncbi:MAG: Asp-tRNA(Asn)/Glu-tRNA(Gln) amidotransferase subunit GatC [Deltaproteobacteria bacterium]|nr:Asp-tRNA(Asn)/Glu-tRNA(Gln) amidotransferase subunit GatC [Deltaproteobacteria bacterium]MBI5811045.1 Asp-tRNA(Asn)/Glu-tRNA(Gln) amidotransferase subunit GatC [Deltaproteobacteria bacterium]